jgi:hypothetical protein
VEDVGKEYVRNDEGDVSMKGINGRKNENEGSR